MLDVQKLLGQFLGTQSPFGGSTHPSSQGRPQGGGSLQDTVGNLIRTHGSSALSGGLAGGLASQLFRGKGVGKMGGSALKLGGAALVAGLAYKAYKNYQATNGAAALPGAAPLPALPAPSAAGELPEPSGTAFLPGGEETSRARLMLSAMIAAAKADGYIDAGEQEAIFGRIDDLGLDSEAKGFVVDEMRRPMSIDDLVAAAATPEAAIEVYTASVLAIDPDHPAERAYLDMLAARLQLPAALTAEVRRTAEEVTVLS
ncbi:protein YebE [Aureimonas sp. SA4125]|uniref:tellurite resistance TerB family protein n=1 Tax=Aureimonas sp. SA4125 TaxID=2826993 RepID=UPI001CC8272B|nr:tellurite resistance TerB family protein [Aureimonas sp. SA4125]BDA86657.1 protein YebE [Aureimonas sp. SA4125]